MRSMFSAFLMPAWERIVRRRDTLNQLAYLEASQWLAPEERSKREVTELRERPRNLAKSVTVE